MEIGPLHHVRFGTLRSTLDEQLLMVEVKARIAAQVADMTDSAIVEAIIECAQKEGITDLYLMDKRFVMEALTEKLERKNQDFVPVVHGRWVIETIDKKERKTSVTCSECEAFFSLGLFDFGLCYNYCPSCGAKMDLEGE